MKHTKPLDEMIENALRFWDDEKHLPFMQEIGALVKMYEGDPDELDKKIEDDEQMTVLAIQYIYIIARIADQFSYELGLFKAKFPNLAKRMETESMQAFSGVSPPLQT